MLVFRSVPLPLPSSDCSQFRGRVARYVAATYAIRKSSDNSFQLASCSREGYSGPLQVGSSAERTAMPAEVRSVRQKVSSLGMATNWGDMPAPRMSVTERQLGPENAATDAGLKGIGG